MSRLGRVVRVTRPTTITERSPAISIDRIIPFLVMVKGIIFKSRVTGPDVVVSMDPSVVGGTTCR